MSKNGQGILKFPDGAIYTGNFINNKANGQGTFIYLNGDKF